MAIGNQLVFDINNNVEDFIFILSTKDYRHLGALQNVIPESVSCEENLNSANTISFEVYKTISTDEKDINEPLWDDIDNLKLVYVRELNEYFEIEVQLDDTTENIRKTIFGVSLCESELSQSLIHGLEINTETDIGRDNYEPTIFYNPENTSASLLHRVLSFAPHYTIMYVDDSLCNMQRTFSVDGTSVYDWLTGECANEFNCLFQFDSTVRGIYVYDLYMVCKDCGHRGEYIDKCSECGSIDLDYFGDDTTIYIDKENLTDAIQFTTDVGSIKNCFKLVAGDDVITSTIRLINPNGSDFIYKPTDAQLAEMPEKLRNKIVFYNALYENSKDEYEQLILELFNASDKINELTYTMMPSSDDGEITAKTEATKLNSAYSNGDLKILGLSSVTTATSLATVESALINYAKVFIKTGYVKVEIGASSYKYVGSDSSGWNYGTWTGTLKVTNYSDEEDIATTSTMSIKVYDNYQNFIEQKIMKNINSNTDEEDSVFDVLSIKDLSNFKTALQKYCFKRLKSFYDAIQLALDVLVETNQTQTNSELYDVLYLPYYSKLQACQNEMDLRQASVDQWQNTYDSLLTQLETIQKTLNFQTYLGEDLYKIFCMYRREDTYQNDNYLSTGLSNPEIIQKAKDFIEVAEKQLEKARTPKHSISSTLYNLLLIPEFKPIIQHFKLGNWLRVHVDDELYRLRLIGYKLSFDSIQNLEVTFSNVTKVNNVKLDKDEILNQVQSMTTSFSYFVEQAKKGNEANVEISRWLENGLNSALVQINNNINEEVTFDKHGLWCRTYNSETGNYDPEQLRITHNILVFTEDNWEHSVLGLGKHNYTYFDGTKFITGVGYGLSAKFLNSSYMYSGQIVGSDIYSENYKIDSSGNIIAGSHIDLKTGGFALGSGKLSFDPVTNTLTLKGVSIEWSSSTTPEITDIDGLKDKLSEIDNSIKTAEENFANELLEYSKEVDGSLVDLQNQIDGNITTWFYDGEPTLNNMPASEWTSNKDKNIHLGDLYYDNLTGYAYRFQCTNSVYSWARITDTDVIKALADAKIAQDTADCKRRVFINTPTPPYDIGDLWSQGETGDILRCKTAKTSTQTYSSSDWVKASKYTDDTALNTFMNGEFQTVIKDIKTQSDQKAETWYQSTDPSTNWTSEEKINHIGDLWYDTTNEKTYMWNGSSWNETKTTPPQEVFDSIDGKAQIFVSQPTVPYRIGDLWFDSTTSDIMTCINDRLTGSFASSDWEKRNKYTDDTSLENFVNGDYSTALTNISTQIDGKADTFYQSEQPHKNYTNVTDNNTYNLYIGDLWYDTSSGKTYMYNKVSLGGGKYNYIWQQMDVPNDLYDVIDGIASIYTTIPNNPNVGDLLIPTSDISGTSYKKNKTYRYDGTSWVEISYTDDTALLNFVNGSYSEDLAAINSQIDQKAETWYQDTDPSILWMTDEDKESHVGDLWYSISEEKSYIYSSTYVWQEANGVPDEVYDAIDGKSTIYTARPSGSQQIGDLLIPDETFQTTSNSVTYTFSSGKVYRCTKSHKSFSSQYWIEISYTDDTTANKALDAAENAQTTANSAKSVAENAETIGNNLVNVLGYDGTKITGTYIYSPVISGGSILVGNKSGTYAEITTDGILNCTGANISGNIITSGGTIGGWTIDENMLSSVADNKYAVFLSNGTNNSITGNNILTIMDLNSLTFPFFIGGDGSFYAENATIKGAITATSLTLGTNVTIGSSNITGLSSVATSGKYSDLSGKPTIPSKLSDLTDGANVLYSDDVSISSSTNSTTKITTTTITYGDKTYTTYTSSDGKYVLTNLGIGTSTASETDTSKGYFYISTDGLLTAKNALVYGTIYATNGEFSGKITSSSGSIGGWTIANKYIWTKSTNENYQVALGSISSGTDPVMWVNDSSSGTTKSPFILYGNGLMVTTNAKIKGGDIGGWTITDYKIYGGDADTRVAVMQRPTANTTYVFAAGGTSHEAYEDCPFRVDKTGKLYSSKAEIGGWTTTDYKIYGGDADTRVAVMQRPTANTTYVFAAGGTSHEAYKDCPFRVDKEGNLYCLSYTASGTKSRLVTTEDYNDRLLYCYETPSPMFGDLGEGTIDETGKCYIFLDDIFAETIDINCMYQVFLQAYGKGECYVTERTSSYFVVEGTENLSFGWELKAIQRDYDTMRLEEHKETEDNEEIVNTDSVLNSTIEYLNSLLYDAESEEF